MSITNCPRCKDKYVDTLEEIFCDSCAAIMLEDDPEEVLGNNGEPVKGLSDALYEDYKENGDAPY